MTDYRQLFSDDTFSFMRSPVREIFKRVDLNAIYSFAGGYPSADTFPISDMQELVGEVMGKYGASALQYGPTQGVPQLREAISARYGVPVDRIQITTSSQQGIDVTSRVLLNPGDVVLTSNPTYLGALQSFKSYRAEIVGVRHSDDSVLFRDNYESSIRNCISGGKKIKFLYVIPDFQNPSGETLNMREREILVELSAEYGFAIVEDIPYRELRYDGESLPTLYSLSPDNVVCLGSFSKIFAPGFRIGWMFANPEFLDMVYVCKQSLDLCPPVLDQYLAAEFLASGRMDDNLQRSIKIYKRKKDLMLSLLEEYMPEGVSWTRPQGGLFLFLTLPARFDSVNFYEKALSSGVAYVAGNFFHTDGGGRNTMRLNFSFMTEDRIREGIILLSELLKQDLA